MGTRVRTLISTAIIGIAAASCLSTAARTQRDEVASRAERTENGVHVTWIFGLSEFTSCDPPTSVIRKLKNEFGEQVRFTAVYVGNDPDRAAHFLRVERLAIPIRQLSLSDFRRRFAGQDLPIVVAGNGHNQRVLTKSAWKSRGSDSMTELQSVVTQMVSVPRVSQ